MPIRITGMASGMDIDKMVSDLMRAERIPLDKLKQKKTLFSWKTDLYREINSQLLSLRQSLFDLRFSSNWGLYKANSSDEAFVKVQTSNTATPGTHKIEVLDLASSALKYSASQISNAGLQGDNAAGLSIDSTNNAFTMTLDGVTRTITLDDTVSYASYDDLLNELQSKINSAFGANKVQVSHDASGIFSFTPVGYASGGVDNRPQLTLSAVSGNDGLTNLGFDLSVTSKPSYKVNVNSTISELDASSKFATALGATSGSFTINGVTINYASTDTLADIFNRVNSSAAGVQMSYDAVADKVTVQSKSVGSGSKVEITADTGGLMASLGLDSTIVTGQDANVKIDGVQSYRNSNTITLDGVTYELLQKTTAPVTVTVSSDSNALLEKIQNFVDIYNETVELFNKRLKEEKFRSYTPLTDEQKDAMSEREIELWEEKAKSGLLAGDSLLRNVLSDMRGALYETVTSVSSADKDALYEIGIETVQYNKMAPNEAGKLKIDEDALLKALQDDPQAVIQLFTNKSAVESEKGIAERLYEKVNKGIDALIKVAGGLGTSHNNRETTLGSQIYQLDTRILGMEARLAKREDYYYRQFTAMEKALQTSNAQMAWLSAQFYGNG